MAEVLLLLILMMVACMLCDFLPFSSSSSIVFAFMIIGALYRTYESSHCARVPGTGTSLLVQQLVGNTWMMPGNILRVYDVVFSTGMKS